MMSARTSFLRRTALYLTLALVVGCLSGCFGRGKDPQDETYGLPGWEEPAKDTQTTNIGGATESDPETEEPTEESTETTEESTEPTEETEPEGLKGTVIGDLLNIRSGPGTNYGISGSLKRNDRVLILELKIVDDKLWGRTEDGWVSLNYILLDDPDQVPTVKETLKGIALEKLKAYAGPGSHYKESGSFKQDARLTITETCGKWGRTEKGWVDLEDVYIDGTEGPDQPVKGSVTGTEVNLRADPSTDCAIKGTVKKGDRVEILFRVTIGDTTWGCIKDGWISMKYVKLDDDVSGDIVGSWYCYWSIVEGNNATNYYSNTYTFNADGTYTCTSYTIDIGTRNGEANYEIYSSGSGTYTYDGSTLTRNNVSESAVIRGEELHWTVSGETYVYVPGDLKASYEEAKSRHEGVVDTPIVGSWYYHTGATSDISVGTIYEFQADGTYDRYEFAVSWDGNGYIKSSSSGTYSYDGFTLILDGVSYPASIDYHMLHVTINGRIYIYFPGDLEDAAKEARSWHGIPDPTEPPETEPPETEPTETEPSETEPPVLNSSIFGTWQELNSCNCTADQLCFGYTGCWTFNSDGTFEGADQGRHYFYTPEGGAVYDDNTPGMGGQQMSGTYTFDGSTLVLTFTYIEWVDLSSPDIQTWQVSISNGHLVMSGSYTRNFYKGNLNEAAARLFAG